MQRTLRTLLNNKKLTKLETDIIFYTLVDLIKSIKERTYRHSLPFIDDFIYKHIGNSAPLEHLLLNYLKETAYQIDYIRLLGLLEDYLMTKDTQLTYRKVV